MTSRDALVEQQILEWESRGKHVDELLSRAEEKVTTHAEAIPLGDELAKLRQEREALQAHIEEIKKKTLEEWQESDFSQGGPMLMWEALAKKIESLVERIG